MFQQNQKIIEDARSIVSLNEGRAKASLQEEQKIIMVEKTPPPTHENPVNPQPQFKASLQEEQETKIGMTTSPPNLRDYNTNPETVGWHEISWNLGITFYFEVTE